MSFLLDTDTCSAYLKGNRLVGRRFLPYSGQLHISVIRLGELFAWVLRAKASPKRLIDLMDFLNDVAVIEVAMSESRRFGEVRAHLLDRGLPAPRLDLFIAATALTHDLTLVTHNTADDQNIPNLRLVDWLIP